MFLNHGDVDMIFADLRDSYWNVNGLNKQLFLFVILIFDKEGNPDIHWLHTLLKLHSPCRFYNTDKVMDALTLNSHNKPKTLQQTTDCNLSVVKGLWVVQDVCTSVCSYSVVAWNHLQIPEVSSLNLFICQFHNIWVTGTRGR